jgi:hypothetical protein
MVPRVRRGEQQLFRHEQKKPDDFSPGFRFV